jgi:hypothetical protein
VAITYKDSQNGGSSTWPITSGAYSTAVQTGDLLICATLYVQGSGATLTMSDNLNSGNYTNVVNTSYGAGSLQLTVGYKVATATGTAGTTQITVTGGSNGNYAAMILLRYNGFVYTPTPVAADTFSNTGHTSGPATIAGFNNSDAAELLVAFIQTASGSTTFGSPGAAWNGRSGANNSQSWDQILTTSGNAISFSSALNQLDYWLDGIVAFYDAPPVIVPTADGNSTASVTSIATGTNGSAMPAMIVGQLWDVIVLNQGTSGNITVSDGTANAYNFVQQLNDGTNSVVLNQFYCMVTVPISSPVITATKNTGGAQAMSIGVALSAAAGIISPTSPYTANAQSNNKQTTPTGSNSQVSGFTQTAPTLSSVLGAWSFCASKAAASAAGTNFTKIGNNLWSFIGTAASVTYETETVAGLTSFQATFTPPGGTNTYTLATLYNVQVVAAGPMPRLIYIMP